MRRAAHVLVVGQGYVGHAIANEAARQSTYIVTGFDTDVLRASALDEIVPYRVVSELGTVNPFDIAVIAVPTLLVDGAPDLRNLRDAARAVGSRLTPGALVVVESTVYPGATREIVATMLKETSGLEPGTDFSLGYSAERLNPGPGSPGIAEIPRVVGGFDDESLRRTRAFYDPMVPKTYPVSSIEVAELSKLIENTFRHINIAFVNELAQLEAALGVDVREALDAAGTKPYGFMKFTPGNGVGGDCIPVSPRYLDWAVRSGGGGGVRFVELANAIDEQSAAHVVDHATTVLAEYGTAVAGARILLVGMAYKKDVPEIRNSSSLRIGGYLRNRGAVVAATDPLIPHEAWPAEMNRVELTGDAIASHDLAVVLVDHTNVDFTPLLATELAILDTTRALRGAGVVCC